mmetsp:Transcript_14277/g.53752  ORF Transcript_14277/g.53752 Transcript_14277/m.53752 type:complete len:262 (-) Transcript_14277:1201-1986(-)
MPSSISSCRALSSPFARSLASSCRRRSSISASTVNCFSLSTSCSSVRSFVRCRICASTALSSSSRSLSFRELDDSVSFIRSSSEFSCRDFWSSALMVSASASRTRLSSFDSMLRRSFASSSSASMIFFFPTFRSFSRWSQAWVLWLSSSTIPRFRVCSPSMRGFNASASSYSSFSASRLCSLSFSIRSRSTSSCCLPSSCNLLWAPTSSLLSCSSDWICFRICTSKSKTVRDTSALARSTGSCDTCLTSSASSASASGSFA